MYRYFGSTARPPTIAAVIDRSGAARAPLRMTRPTAVYCSAAPLAPAAGAAKAPLATPPAPPRELPTATGTPVAAAIPYALRLGEKNRGSARECRGTTSRH
jgi:hypothetical protein